MRTLIDIPEQKFQELTALSNSQGIPRAEAIRRAVELYLNRHSLENSGQAFGLWKGRMPDGAKYQQKLRQEWE